MPGKNRTASGVLGGLAGLVGLSAVAGVLISATVTPAIALSGAAASSAITMFDKLPSVLDIDKLMLPTTIYAKNPDTGEYVEMTQFYDQNRSPVEFDEIAPIMYDSILSSEDPRYYSHGGVDLIGTTRAVMSNVAGGAETQGGSSISQQYVKNILVQRCEAEAANEEERYNCWFEATRSDGSEGIQRKLQEMRYAISLEQKYSKNDILLGYLNIANFGGTTYGIDAASRYYFGVAAKDLSLAQAATLAGIVQNPNTYRIDQPNNEVNGAADGYALTKQRQQYVLGRLLDDGKITQEQFDEVYEAPIEPKITQPKTGCAAATGAEYFCQYVRYVIERDPAFGETEEERKEVLRRGGLNVYTTLDWRMQNSATATMAENVPSSADGGRLGASTVSIEASTGRILSIAQNTKFRETSSDDANFTSIVYAGDSTFGNSGGFQAGSTFKLFTLLDWLEKGHSVREVVNGRDTVVKTFDTCNGTYVNADQWKPGNFGGGGGYVATPMEFTRDSLNSGYIAMAAELDLCDIGKVATKMGLSQTERGTAQAAGVGEPISTTLPNQVIGSDSVSPIAMAGAYATVANNGTYCEPKAIDKITDADGNEVALPERTCTEVLDPAVAATAAYALEGVMRGGTGSQGNPYDGTSLVGKTGTHQQLQTWLVESSSKVATASWVGNVDESYGTLDMFRNWTPNGIQFSQLRYVLARNLQGTANSLYGGDAFPQPDQNLTRQVLRDLPNVVGKSVEEATGILENAGFNVEVGDAVESSIDKGLVAEQSPGAGRVAGGTTVTLSPSNGRGVTVPDVSGRSLDSALSALRKAGFRNVQGGSCTADENAGRNPEATGTDPGAGSEVSRDTTITVNYTARNCGGDGGGGNGGDTGGDTGGTGDTGSNG
ncbi:transglycosylase domain-containing protein [Microbacterium hominis]|uniref:Transglycosylase domain-containing protein n=1 Tax=Microbacterium hominis TaxID=162426 RepID=A0A7D4Q1C9_9MICO|nr:transglycosylase domain-containing protein [Microbacterium hominis]QKJ18771.1 transglycosylase domain-containing protein [Microbacterium hominis]